MAHLPDRTGRQSSATQNVLQTAQANMSESASAGLSTENHYRVVRYYNDYNIGLIKEVLASDLTLDDAQSLFEKESGRVPAEDIVIQDQNKQGIEAEIESVRS